MTRAGSDEVNPRRQLAVHWSELGTRPFRTHRSALGDFRTFRAGNHSGIPENALRAPYEAGMGISRGGAMPHRARRLNGGR